MERVQIVFPSTAFISAFSRRLREDISCLIFCQTCGSYLSRYYALQPGNLSLKCHQLLNIKRKKMVRHSKNVSPPPFLFSADGSGVFCHFPLRIFGSKNQKINNWGEYSVEERNPRSPVQCKTSFSNWLRHPTVRSTHSLAWWSLYVLSSKELIEHEGKDD